MNKKIINYFNTIVNFINELSSLYGKKTKPLTLYQHLLSKTTFSCKDAINKNVNLFKTFCIENKENILERKLPLKNTLISYSSKVFLDINEMMVFAKEDNNLETIWSYLLTFLAMTDPSSNAKNILKHKSDDNSKKFIDNIIGQLEDKVDPNIEEPNVAIGTIWSSGILSNIIGDLNEGVESGELNMDGLIGTLSGMLVKISSDAGDDPQCMQAISMATGLLNNLEKKEKENVKIEEIED